MAYELDTERLRRDIDHDYLIQSIFQNSMSFNEKIYEEAGEL